MDRVQASWERKAARAQALCEVGSCVCYGGSDREVRVLLDQHASGLRGPGELPPRRRRLGGLPQQPAEQRPDAGHRVGEGLRGGRQGQCRLRQRGAVQRCERPREPRQCLVDGCAAQHALHKRGSTCSERLCSLRCG